jgi:hypothetical protein
MAACVVVLCISDEALAIRRLEVRWDQLAGQGIRETGLSYFIASSSKVSISFSTFCCSGAKHILS